MILLLDILDHNPESLSQQHLSRSNSGIGESRVKLIPAANKPLLFYAVESGTHRQLAQNPVIGHMVEAKTDGYAYVLTYYT